MHVQPNELLRITLVYFSTLNSFFNINSTNNTFKFKWNTGNFTTCTLTPGNYTLAQICTLFTSTISTLTSTTVLTVSCPDTTNNYSSWILNTGTGTATIDFSLSDGLHLIMGFTTTLKILSLSTTATKSTKCMYSGSPTFLQLHANMPPQNCSYNITQNSVNYSDILANIPVIVPTYSQILFQEFSGDNNTFEFPAKGMRLGTVNFYITNNFRTPMPLVDDYDFVLKAEVLIDDENEHLGVSKQMLDLHKLQTLNLDHYFNRS